MNNLATCNISSFRSAKDLVSKEPAQLLKTIRELEARVQEQNVLLDQKDLYIEEISKKMSQIELEVEAFAEKTSQKCPEGIGALESAKKIESLQKAVSVYEHRVEDFEDGFWSLFHNQDQRLEEYVKMLYKMPQTPEVSSLIARVRKESKAIKRAKASRQLTPVNALQQLADLERAVVSWICERPQLYMTGEEKYRAEVLVELFATDKKLKCVTSPEAQKVLTAREDKPIGAKQALRAMRKAASQYPDRVRFEKSLRGRSSRLVKILEGE